MWKGERGVVKHDGKVFKRGYIMKEGDSGGGSSEFTKSVRMDLGLVQQTKGQDKLASSGLGGGCYVNCLKAHGYLAWVYF